MHRRSNAGRVWPRAASVYVSARLPLLDDFRPHVWRTEDYGETWTRIVDGIRDDAYVNSVREDPNREGLLYAGTNHGVYVTFDDGGWWQELNPGLPDMPVTVSLRVRDKTEREIDGFVSQCIDAGFDGILVLMGDPPRYDRSDTGQVPSAVVERLRGRGVDAEIDIYMSVSNSTTPRQIQKKIRARPSGFFTQVVQNAEQVRDIAGQLDGFRVVPVILYPSPKNQKSAEFLNLDLSSYEREFDELVREAYRITGDILITSPNDFAAVDAFLAGFGGRT